MASQRFGFFVLYGFHLICRLTADEAAVNHLRDLVAIRMGKRPSPVRPIALRTKGS